MSQFFNLARFGRLFRKHTAEHYGGYLLASGVLMGGIGLVLGFVAYSYPGPLDPGLQAVVFTMGLLAAGPFFSSLVFAPLGNPRKATADLLLPASHAEKYLVGWLYSLPLFLAVYVGCFYAIDSVVLQLDDWRGSTPELVDLFSSESKLYRSVLTYAVVNAVFLWGSIYFVKQQFIRTAFAVLLGRVLLTVVNKQVVQALVGRPVTLAAPYLGLSLKEGPARYEVGLPPEQNRWVLLVPLGLALLGWGAAYTRVQEKQL